MAPFRWTNCHADRSASSHSKTIRSYFANVAAIAMKSLERQIEALEHSREAYAAFESADQQVVLAQTKMAFALSIQSIWERQLRNYLADCAVELRPNDGLAQKVEHAHWDTLRKLFLNLRGISIKEFPSYNELDTLQLLGNACRHGDGPSAVKLAEKCPEFWASLPRRRRSAAVRAATQTVGSMVIPIGRLEGLSEAVAVFWEDVGYIYDESIQKKHPSLVARPKLERKRRKWRPQAR